MKVLKIILFLFAPALALLVAFDAFLPELRELEIPGLGSDRELVLDRTRKILLTAVWLGVILVIHQVVSFLLSPEHRAARQRRELPGLVRDLVRFSISLLLLALVLNWIWGGFVTPLLGALGIGGIVLGFALQDTLSNFFAGLSLVAEQPIGLGDWVQIGAGAEGRVERMTWRAVQIRTRNEDLLVFPNSMVAKETINNFKLPMIVEAIRIRVNASYRDAPDRVKSALLEVAASVSGVLAKPDPVAQIVTFGEFAMTYELKCFINDYERRPAIEDQIRHRIWYAFRRHELEIPYPSRAVYHRSIGPEDLRWQVPEQASHENAVSLLRRIPIFSSLSPSELAELASRARVLDYAEGETVLRQGDPGDTLYAIGRGRVRVLFQASDGVEHTVAELGPGDFVGEMSLLTGERRSATVRALSSATFCAVSKQALLPILQGNPALAEPMAAIATERRQALDRFSSNATPKPAEEREHPTRQGVLERIRAFFGIGHTA